MGFGEGWIRWIRYCITTVKFSILINGELISSFSPHKGLRQGDPLSPFLFILAIEGLIKIIHKATQLQWLEGFRVGNEVETFIGVSHLLYADDTLIFCGSERSQVMYLNLTLMIFEAVSGLHTNMLKRTIYPVNEVPELEEFARLMCCNVGSFPTVYLGLPLGAKYKSQDIWNGVIENFEKRLASWQMQYLSLGGRVTLINSVLGSIQHTSYHFFQFQVKYIRSWTKLEDHFFGRKIAKDIYLT